MTVLWFMLSMNKTENTFHCYLQFNPFPGTVGQGINVMTNYFQFIKKYDWKLCLYHVYFRFVILLIVLCLQHECFTVFLIRRACVC